MAKHAALVTGGAKRIGQRIALMLASEGYDILLHYYQSDTDATNTAQRIKALGVECELVKLDLLDNHAYEALISQSYALFPHLNLLINNASLFEPTSFLDTSSEDFDRHFNLNVKAPFFLIQEFLKNRAADAPEGQVINILDAEHERNVSQFFTYMLTKRALKEITVMAAKECGAALRVNAVAPGVTTLPQILSNEYIEQQKVKTPLQQLATVDDVAEAVKALISQPMLTGQILYVDGGARLA